MRKQVLLGMMMFAMGASLIGCGKSDGKTDNATTTITSENQVVNESTEIKKDETKNDTSDWIRYSIDPKGSVRCPKYFSSRTSGGGEYLYKTDSNPYFIVIDGGYENELNSNSFDDVFDNL